MRAWALWSLFALLVSKFAAAASDLAASANCICFKDLFDRDVSAFESST